MICVPPPELTVEEGVAHRLYLWPNDAATAHWCDIDVAFLGGDAWQQQRVRDVIANGWNRVSGAQFRFVDRYDAPVRVAFEPGSSWSQPGTGCLGVAFGEPTLNLGWVREDMSEAEVRRVILHEFGHALGLMHTHMQPNVPIPWNYEAVYEFYRRTNNWPPEVVQSQVLSPLANDIAVVNEYGPSIMGYGIPAELLTDPAWAMERVTDLQPGDVALVQQLYGPAPDLPQTHLPIVRQA